MSIDKISRMKELVALLQKAAYAYEQEDTEIMSNYEYDALYDELLKLEEETGTVLAGSVTQKVGYEIASSLPKVTHPKRMLSLDKTKEVSKLKSFLADQEGLLSWKLDDKCIFMNNIFNLTNKSSVPCKSIANSFVCCGMYLNKINR